METNIHDILLWRSWEPAFDFPLSFSALEHHGVGGTELQMLWHARQLVRMGYRIQVLGASFEDVVDEDVEFIGADNREDQIRLIHSAKVRCPQIIFLEGAFHAARVMREMFPSSRIVHVGQNIDRLGAKLAFAQSQWIDIFGFVSPGHLAYYTVKYPALRHKFMLLRNCVWCNYVYKTPHVPLSDNIVWIGSWQKLGLRRWAEVMEKILQNFPKITWTLCGPKYNSKNGSFPMHLFHGLSIPPEKVRIVNLPLAALAKEIASAQVCIVSLGNETGAISCLDVHALGRPVISGNDVVYKWANPEGTGIRCTTHKECYNAIRMLLTKPEVADSIGKAGQSFVLDEYTEENQRKDLERIINYLKLLREGSFEKLHNQASGWKEFLLKWDEKVKRKSMQMLSMVKRSREPF